MKTKKIPSRSIFISLISTFIVAFIAVSVWVLTSFPIRLNDDAVQTFRVGGHHVEIETRSISISGEDGDALILVSTGGVRTSLQSSFDYDLWNNYPPGYTSLDSIDDHFGRDLIIWRRNNSGTLSATEYVSNGDGKLHILATPLDVPWWDRMVD